MSDLPMPKGWAQASLGDLADFTNGKAFKKEEWLETGKPIIRIQNLNNPSAKFNYADDSHEQKYLVRNGDLLVSWSASLGVYYWSSGDAWLNQHIFRVNELRGCDKNFLKYALEISIDDFYAKAHGMGMVHITKGNFESHLVPLPPISEQTRIAAKLDELLAQVNILKTRIDGTPALLKRFRQSVLSAAVSGRLTEEWRAQHSKAGWKQLTFGDAGEISGGLTKNAKRAALPLAKPYLRVANVHANSLSLDDVTQIGLTEKEFKKTQLVSGDILIVEGNGSLDHIGRAAIWNNEIPDCCHQNHLIRWRANYGMHPKFALYQLLSPQGRKQLVEVAKSTTGLHTLSISKISALKLPIPTADEQTEIVRRVEQLFTFADQLEARVKIAQERIDRLTQSILTKAFRGELVAQDPNDEPASVLLDRIKAQRAAAPKAKRGRRSAMAG